jgi:hypothetical protein
MWWELFPAQSCVGYLIVAFPLCGTRADFSKQWTPTVLPPEMSKHIRPVFAVTEATVALTVAETGGTAKGGDG